MRTVFTSKRKALGLVLGLILFIGFHLFPTPKDLKPEAMRMVGVTLLMAAW